MFRPSKAIKMEKKRHVVLAIKTTANKERGYSPKNNKITEVACLEMVNGKATGGRFHSHGDFDDVSQSEFLDFLQSDPNTKIIVHFKKFVLDFLRHELSEEGNDVLAKFSPRSEHRQRGQKDRMENMISKASQLAKDGKYIEGRVPFQIEHDKQKLMPGRAFYNLKQVCTGMGVNTTHYHPETATAMQEAELLVKAEYNRLQHVKSEQQQVESPRHAM